MEEILTDYEEVRSLTENSGQAPRAVSVIFRFNSAVDDFQLSDTDVIAML